MAYLLISVKVDGLLYFHPPYKYNRTEKTYIYNNNYKVDINICTIETGLWDNLREQDLFISRINLHSFPKMSLWEALFKFKNIWSFSRKFVIMNLFLKFENVDSSPIDLLSHFVHILLTWSILFFPYKAS
jgi:hypothetical protein